jgi:hypothetical protein
MIPTRCALLTKTVCGLALFLALPHAVAQQQTPLHTPVPNFQRTASRPFLQQPAPPKLPVRPEAGKEPKIVFERDFHEFGTVDEGVESETTFPFRNEGAGDLYIVHFVPRCACSGIWIEVEGKLYNLGDPIPPGARGLVHFVMRTLNFKDSKFSEVELHTNDPSRAAAPTSGPVQGGPPFGVVPLKVHANIVKIYDFEPMNTLSLGSLLNLDETNRTIYFKNNKGASFDIVGFEPANDPIVKLRTEPADASKSRWKIDVTIPAGQPLGSITKVFHLKTNPEVHGAIIYVLATIRGAVETNPMGLFAFGPISQGKGVMRTLTVVNHHPSATLKLGNIRVLDPQDKLSVAGDAAARLADATIRDNLKISIVETKPGKETAVNVEVLPSMPLGVFGVRLAFSTGIPGGPDVLTIPMSGYVR